jgi:hypothetical protein
MAGKFLQLAGIVVACIVSCAAVAAEALVIKFKRVSVDCYERQVYGGSNYASISANGRFVVFSSNAPNLVEGQNPSWPPELYVRDLSGGCTFQVTARRFLSTTADVKAAISSDGRYIAFSSNNNQLVAGTNDQWHVYVKDVETGAIEKVSVSSAGVQGNGGSVNPSISCDGRYVTFSSNASNLVPGESPNGRDVYVRDRTAGTTIRVSVSSSGGQGNDSSYSPSISCDGQLVSFASLSNNLVADNTNSVSDIFVHDRTTATTSRVSVDSTGAQSNNGSCCSAISGDGRFVGFASVASNLVEADNNSTWDMFVHDRQTGATTRVSTSSAGVEGNSASDSPSLSHDGGVVVFQSYASNLVAVDANNEQDVFRYDRQTGSVERLGGNGLSMVPSISASGWPITFSSSASDLVRDDTNNAPDLFIALLSSGYFRSTFERLKRFEWLHVNAERVRCMIAQSCGLVPDPVPPLRFQDSAMGWQREIFAPPLNDLYRAAWPLLRDLGKIKDPQAVAKALSAAVRKAPLGAHFTKTLQSLLLRDLEALDHGKTPINVIQGKVLEVLNAVELDARTGVLPTGQVAAGKTASVYFPRLFSIKFKNIAKAGTLSVTTRNDLPAWADGMAPSWPILHYSLDFSGRLAKNGEVEVEFYVGDVAFSPLSLRRVFEWDGKAYRDITVSVDHKRGVITRGAQRNSPPM